MTSARTPPADQAIAETESRGTPGRARRLLPAALSGLGARLLVLVLVTALPLGLLLVIQATDARGRALGEALAETSQLAGLASRAESDVIEETRAVLAALVLAADTRDPSSTACDRYAAAILSSEPHLINVGVTDASGLIVCSGLPSEPVSAVDRSWYRRALDTRGAAVGDYQVGRITGQPSVNVALPMPSESGDWTGAAFAAVSTDAMSDLLLAADLPADAAATVVDRNGTVVAREPEPEGWVGQPLPDAPVVEALLSGAETGEVVGIDGVPRVYAFAPVGDPDVTGLRLSLGFSAASIYGEADRTIRTGLAGLAVALLVAAVLAVLGGRALVLRPVNSLLAATRRLATGDLSARVGAHGGTGEIGELARAFDTTAAALQERTEELERLIHARTTELESFFGLSRDLFTIVDVEGRFRRVNAAWEGALGYPVADLVGRRFIEFVHPEDRERTLAEFAREIELGHTTIRFQNRYLHRDGTTRWLEWTAQPELEAGGVFAVARDVTETRAAEEELRVAEGRVREYLDTAIDALVVLEAVRDGTGAVVDFRTTYANEPAGALVGRSPRTMIGDLLSSQPADVSASRMRVFGEVLETGRGVTYEARSPDPRTGEERLLAVRVSRMADGVAVVFRDVTTERQAEAEIRAAKEEAEAANRSKSEFLSRMSHELRTPLNAIIGFAQLLDMDQLQPSQREAVGHILTGGRHLLDLINEVLDISRIETGQLSISTEPVALAEAVDDAQSLVAPMAADGGIQLRIGSLPPDSAVMADRQRLKQVLLNLLSNAVKYNRPGGSVTLAARLTEGGQIRIEVVDEGPGISPAMLPRVFAPFDRLDAERGGVEGTGLGLALSRALVEHMGGRIGVDSTPGAGSTFWFELPAGEASAANLPPGPTSTAGGRPAKSGVILYIEDNPSNVRLIERALTRRPGVRLIPAMLGSLGVELAREHHPDLVLLDLHLPDVRGEEVMARLRADPATRDIPIVVLSAEAQPLHREELFALGAHDYLTKPFDLADLYRIVDAIVTAGANEDGPR